MGTTKKKREANREFAAKIKDVITEGEDAHKLLEEVWAEVGPFPSKLSASLLKKIDEYFGFSES